MSAEAAIATRTWSVGRYEVTLTVPRPKPGSVVACAFEWDPQVPSNLTPEEWQQYRRGRDEAVAEVSRALGITSVVVEL